MGAEVTGQICGSLQSHRTDFGVHPECDGDTGRLQAWEGCDLTQVFTRSLWLPVRKTLGVGGQGDGEEVAVMAQGETMVHKIW